LRLALGFLCTCYFHGFVDTRKRCLLFLQDALPF
jgi:hypothetical protein